MNLAQPEGRSVTICFDSDKNLCVVEEGRVGQSYAACGSAVLLEPVEGYCHSHAGALWKMHLTPVTCDCCKYELHLLW